MFFVPRSAAMIDSDDEELVAGMDACGLDDGEEAGGDDGGKRKKKAAAAPKRKKPKKLQRQYKDHVPTTWDARIQFTGLPTLTWESARHPVIRRAVKTRMCELRYTPLLAASDALCGLRLISTMDQVTLLCQYWKLAPAQTYRKNASLPCQRVMCQLRNLSQVLPLYRSANKCVFSICDDILEPALFMLKN
jgi:hypothetical protein